MSNFSYDDESVLHIPGYFDCVTYIWCYVWYVSTYILGNNGSSWAQVSVTADISGDQSDRNVNIFSFFAPAAWNFCSWGTTNALDWFHVWKWRLNVLFESPTPWQHTYTQYMGVQFTLGWHCGSHTRAPKRFHFVMMVLMKKRFEFVT